MKKKKNISDLKNAKAQHRKKTSTNPFEVHVNKQKFNVLGRKMKQDRGLPGLARAKSIKKRKETLLQEYKVKDKANQFLDRRIGENNAAMTKEDRILARFTAERLKSHKRKAMFNLGEDEVLTHKGRSLEEIENFENPSSDEDDNEYSKGKLDANFVEEAHFGGGLFKKVDESKGRAAIIDQLIAESKKRKAEKQQAKEKTLEKTDQLDSEWRELMPLVSGTGSSTAEPVDKKDPYDLLMNQLRFEARGTPSDRLKSESELVAEEARRLRELEEERLRRMRGEEDANVSESSGKRQHRSADDLDDGFEFEQEEEFQLLYNKEGKLISKVKENEGEEKEPTSPKPELDKDVENYENTEEDDDDDEEEEEGEVTEEEKEHDGQEGNNEDLDDSSDSEGEGVFDLSDMKNKEKEDASEEELEVEEHLLDDEVINKVKNLSKEVARKEDIYGKDEISKKKVAFDPVVKTIEVNKTTKTKSEEQLRKEEEERTRLMENAKLELPFTFKIPETYDDFFELMEDKSETEQAIIVERMIKCNHPSLNEKNKPELNKLFAFLLQLLNDAQYVECWILLDHMAPFLYELTKFSPSDAAYNVSEVLKEKHIEFIENKHRYPSTETLLFLKLIALLFPTSDKRHPVTTPALVFISEMLHQCRVTTRRAIASGLLVVTIFTQYVNLSKRILPEAINFLCGIIHMATPPSSKGLIVPPFKREHKFLYLHNSCTDMDDENLKMQSRDLSPKLVKIDDKFRVRSVFLAINLIGILTDQWREITGSWLILSPVVDHISALELDKYPRVIGKVVENIKISLNDIRSKGFEQIVKQERKPKALRLYDPNIQPVYENRKRKLNDEKSDHKRLLNKYKREMKGALREIRRDRTFLSNVKFKEIAKSDAERINKVKEIYNWGSQQQAELNKLARQKRRKK